MPPPLRSFTGHDLSLSSDLVQSPDSTYFPNLEKKSSLGSPPLNSNSAWGTRKRRWIPRPDDPTRHPARTLILCFDGTGDQFDNDNSNVVQFVAALKKDDPSRQMVYYQPGIGTSTTAGPGFRALSKALDLMLAWSLDKHVRDGYEFLMQNYSIGDKICIFGFSRGAYTALGLAGMLQKVGLLPPYNKQQLPFAYHMYSREDDEALLLATEFKDTFSIDVSIDFVGVWDTVCSVGFIPRYLPFVTSNSSIQYFRHALALDEHRAKFMPNYHRSWENDEDITPADLEVQAQGLKNVSPSPEEGAISPSTPSAPEEKGHPRHRQSTIQEMFEERINKSTGRKTDSLEVWFAGAHTDVGGGSVPNHTRHSLSRIPLRWMIRECFKCQTGIIFDMDMLTNKLGMDIDMERERIGMAPERLHPGKHDAVPAPRLAPDSELEDMLSAGAKSLWYGITFPIRVLASVATAILPQSWHYEALPATNSHHLIGATTDELMAQREPFMGEAVEELHDALSPTYDQLRLARHWWLLEWIPLKHKKGQAIHLSSNNANDYHWLINRGEGRKVYKAIVKRGIKVHRSVRTRIEALDQQNQGKAYVPQIRPNIICYEGLPHEQRVCRRMTHEEWMDGKVDGVDLDKPWFEWV